MESPDIQQLAERGEADAAKVHYRAHRGPRSSHQQIFNLVRRLNRSPILDVGAAQGMLGQMLQGSGLVIDGVEPNPAWAEAARPFYRNVHTGTIETANPAPSHYQLIVCADVIEHTVDPLAVLRQLRTHATDDAAFIISLPNVAHLAVRTMLLLGAFPKMERGILDRTHLHFFTRKTAIDLLHSAGLAVEQVATTGVPLEEFSKSESGRQRLEQLSRLQDPLLAVLPKLFAFQWIFLAKGFKAGFEGVGSLFKDSRKLPG